MAEFKSGFVAIIGKTNVGKSTLINKLVGEKVAITVNKSQTTRTAIRAIVNRENSQIIFIDTPGVHKPKTKLGETMLETAYEIAEDVDNTDGDEHQRHIIGEGQRRHRSAEEERARVAHEDLGGMEIVDEETEQSPNERRGINAELLVALPPEGEH